jgi:hypothetical protein
MGKKRDEARVWASKQDEDAAWRAFCDFSENMFCGDPREPWEVPPLSPPKPKTRRRKMTVQQAMKQATKAGLAVQGVIVKADGVELQLSEAVETVNPWDQVQ